MTITTYTINTKTFYSNQNKRVVKANNTFRAIVQNMLEYNNQKLFQKNNKNN